MRNFNQWKCVDLKETHWLVHRLVQVHSTWTEYTYKCIYIYIYILEKGLIPKKIYKYNWNVFWKSSVKIRQFTSLVTFFTTSTYTPLTSLIGPRYRLRSTIEITILLYLRAIWNILCKGWKRYIEKNCGYLVLLTVATFSYFPQLLQKILLSPYDTY